MAKKPNPLAGGILTANQTAPAENPANAGVLVRSIASLLILDEATLVSIMKLESTTVASAHLGMGKMLFALDKKKGKATLQKYARKAGLGEIDSSAYKCFSAFRLVRDTVTQNAGDPGTIEEAHYDASRLRWLILVSQILNLLEKEFTDASQAEFCASIREETAKPLREPTSKTPEVLKGIYEQLQALTEQGEDEGGGEGEQGEQSLDALELATALLGCLKSNGEAIHACEDPAAIAAAAAKLPQIAEMLRRCGVACDYIGGMLAAKSAPQAPEVVPASETPVETPEAAPMEAVS